VLTSVPAQKSMPPWLAIATPALVAGDPLCTLQPSSEPNAGPATPPLLPVPDATSWGSALTALESPDGIWIDGLKWKLLR
jgi:hypothetical protein